MSSSLHHRIGRAMMRLLARLMPSCKDVSGLVSAGLDRPLPLHQRFFVRLHLAMCVLCRRYERQLRLLHEGTQRYANPDLNRCEDSLSPAARERLKRTLQQQDYL